ncbi:MAG: aconitase family protein [Acidimicrobiales bacterium]
MDASAPPPDPPKPASGMTMAEQVLARTAGLSRVSAGQYVTAAPDVLMCHEALTMCASQLRRVGVERLAHPERVHVVLDHFFPAPSAAAAKDHVRARRLVEQYGITNFHGHAGICHQVLVERACVRPGQLVLGTDSHSTTYGAVGAMGAGIGVTEMTYALATGELWFQVPPTAWVVLTGAGGPGLMAKDLALALGAAHGTDVAQYAAIEFAGPLAERLSTAGRMTMANMGAELGAKFAAFPADDRTVQYLADAGADPAAVERFGPQPGAAYARTVTVDSTGLAPQVARPHNPGNVSAVGEVAGTAVHQAFLGSCTNARLEDLAVAAEVLAGRRVHPGCGCWSPRRRSRCSSTPCAPGTSPPWWRPAPTSPPPAAVPAPAATRVCSVRVRCACRPPTATSWAAWVRRRRRCTWGHRPPWPPLRWPVS